MRKSEWVDRLKIQVVPFDFRKFNPMGGKDGYVMVVKDIFTTLNGSWEPSEKFGSIPQWARDEYLRPHGAKDYFDDAGADHHLFVRVIGRNGMPITNTPAVAWSDGIAKINDPKYKGFVPIEAKAHSGWGNIPLFDGSVYYPDMGQEGPWSVTTLDTGELVKGIGMPNGWHVSVFIVFEEVELKAEEPIHTPLPVISVEKDTPIIISIRNAAWDKLGVNFNRDAAFGKYASSHKMGYPVTQEHNLNGIRYQGFSNGIVYCPIGQWDKVTSTGW